jgi:regulator of replication initiation timing
MKHLAACVFFLLAFALSPARAQSTADDQYVIIYSLMQQADSFASSGQPNRALAEYVEVRGELQKLHNIYPDWNPKIINFRMNYLAEKIAEVTAQIPAANAPPPTVKAAGLTPAISATNFPNADSTAELNSLRAQLQSLQDDNTTLQAKLKEALQSQPAAIDSRELVKAQEQIRSLMKENDLLKVGLSQGRKGRAAVLETNALVQVQAALAGANQKLAEQMERVDRLALENQALQARVQSLLASPDATEALREENALLKKQLAELKMSAPTNSPETAILTSALAAAQGQIVVLKSQVGSGRWKNWRWRAASGKCRRRW